MKFIILILVLTCSAFSIAQAQQETHGGDGFAVEFLQLYSELRSHFTENEIVVSEGKIFSIQALDLVRPKLKVVSSAKVYWNGKEVSARNTPAQYLVELSQTHWVLLNLEQKMSLVLHEVLPIAGWIDDDYLVSMAILRHLAIKPGQSALRTLADGLLSCNSSVLQSMSAGYYQSFMPEVRADLIHMALISGCPYFLNQAVQFSSLSEVQMTCDQEEHKTPFEILVRSVGSAKTDEIARLQQMFDIIFPVSEQGPLFCKSESAMISKGTICEVLKSNGLNNSDLLKAISKKAHCF